MGLLNTTITCELLKCILMWTRTDPHQCGQCELLECILMWTSIDLDVDFRDPDQCGLAQIQINMDQCGL